ncbi:inactive peptidyl-prolyl cis-trans isomerase FKBP6 [Bacillus rossius redtenbacheri]|uniref:inactive peptidyl-prolyl cis-trans isomerase FKBP6 n=1 Tax=Bacillus rossius redtenbacheri TaxID=93214 RepID=UPI002FDEF068
MATTQDGLGTRLQEALNLRELMDTSVTTFAVAPPDSDDELDTCQNNFVQDTDVLERMTLSCLDMGEDTDSTLSPFERIASKMTNVTGCGKVRKQVLRPGEGSPVPENAAVVIHYNAFIEHFDEPFDSTYLRGKPDRFTLSSDAVIPGLQAGLRTMRKREKAYFLVHPDMAYGELGCPPRIPPNAEVLFEVELLSFLEDPGFCPEDDPRQKSFDDHYKSAQAFNLQGNDEFLRGNTKVAVARYRQATSIMERVRMENEEQEARYKKLLFRLYTNLAVCYNKDCKPYKVLDVCKRAHAIADDTRGKLLFNQGRALLTIGDFQPALRCLNKARKLAPSDETISKEIRKLNTLRNKFNDEEKMRLARSFGLEAPKTANGQAHTEGAVSEGFADTARSILLDLKDGRRSAVPLPKGLTGAEEAFIKSEACQLGVAVHISSRGGHKSLCVARPAAPDQ